MQSQGRSRSRGLAAPMVRATSPSPPPCHLDLPLPGRQVGTQAHTHIAHQRRDFPVSDNSRELALGQGGRIPGVVEEPLEGHFGRVSIYGTFDQHMF